jgi:hypothetical protein
VAGALDVALVLKTEDVVIVEEVFDVVEELAGVVEELVDVVLTVLVDTDPPDLFTLKTAIS